ncbi:MAG TPA: penicillin-binding transpeptidase domain-containing protein, partial [Sinorhizobium sp.]|nr:penicillin-binding transpeptidase domain-containing protein [Sinorhizobium sp.]
RISTADGTVLYENTYDNPPRVLDPAIVSEMNQMMVGVLTNGTGKKARLADWEAAGKTGTTQSFRDALFVGYTSNLTTGVWFGNDDGKSMKKVTGGGLPATAWHDFMVAAHEGLSPAPLFGTTGVQPVFDEGAVTSGEALPDGFASGNPEAFPEPPPAMDGAVAVDQMRPAGEPMDGGPVPPAGVGEATGTTRRTTLFELLTGG